jgi:cytochrome b involved in lipid metabolism
VTIDNKIYDLTLFKDHHPGGRLILEQYHEKDATDVFWSFHGKEGHERLANMKGMPVESELSPKIASFRNYGANFLKKEFSPRTQFGNFTNVPPR